MARKTASNHTSQVEATWMRLWGTLVTWHWSHYAELCLSTSRATAFTIDASSRAAWRIPIMSYSGPYGFPLTTTPCQRLLHSHITSCQAVVFTFFNHRGRKAALHTAMPRQDHQPLLAAINKLRCATLVHFMQCSSYLFFNTFGGKIVSYTFWMLLNLITFQRSFMSCIILNVRKLCNSYRYTTSLLYHTVDVILPVLFCNSTSCKHITLI